MTTIADAERFSNLDGQLKAMTGHVGRVDASVVSLAKDIGAFGERLSSMDKRMERMELSNSAIRDDIRKLGDAIREQIAGLSRD